MNCRVKNEEAARALEPKDVNTRYPFHAGGQVV
jgi:hypothetical protein